MAGLCFKEDWDEAKDRFRLWWKRQNSDRPVMILSAPREKPLPCAPLPPEPASVEDRWLDIDWILARTEHDLARTAFLGENFPHTVASLGPGAMGTFLGARPVFEPTTIWYEPCFSNIAKAKVRFNARNRWFKWTVESTRKAVERAASRYLVAHPDYIENTDTLAALLGSTELLYYLTDAPAEVHRLQRELIGVWFRYYDPMQDLVRDADGGSAFMAFNIWGPGRVCKLQCDMSAMISPEMFAEFVQPYLKAQIERLDFTVYHLDGPNAVRHLDLVLALERLDCLQWTPGAGQPCGGDPCWDGIYRKALDAGKCVHASMPAGMARDFVRRFGKRGVLLCLNEVESESEGRRLIEEAKRW